jgi:hypothetical protein
MNSIEELRYLILATQREGDRLLSAALEPIGLTTSQAEVLRVLYDYAPLSLRIAGNEWRSPPIINGRNLRCPENRKVRFYRLAER